ncbi:VanZ family protein [Peribacillus kribbensis]|uniref:VanZ family protein n=1 Tax=Peribacillus kribbensis TaxID=356658 RepID=UPI00047E8FA8|nr:VanZ family protein [Peribacillus kribbensis]
MKNVTKIIVLLLLAVCVIVMFQSSNTPYQKQDLRPTLQKYITLDENSLPSMNFDYGGALVTSSQPYDFIEFFIRKAGHISEYFILTSLLLLSLQFTRLKLIARVLLSFVIALAFACTDEYHQSFIKGRTGHLIDVFSFDLLGIVLSIIIYTSAYYRFEKRYK